MAIIQDRNPVQIADTLKLGLQGMFLYLAEEEKAIRENPAKRTTELLQKVFAR